MNARILIYPALAAAAATILSGFLEKSSIAFALSCLVFGLLLFILVALRRRPETPHIPSEFSAKIANLENLAQRQQKLIAERDDLIKLLQTEINESASQASQHNAQTLAYEAALKKAQRALEQSQGADEQAVVQFIRNLQKRGRFLDFIMADIHKLGDQQVGSASRVVHQGLREMMDDYFAVKPVAIAEEGSLIAIPKADLGQSYQLLHSRGDELPLEGRLLHKGWQASHLKLPQSQKLEATHTRLVLAPAEIDVGESN